MKAPDLFSHSNVLFYTVGITAAALVKSTAGRRRQVAMQFKDAHAALTWCLANRAAFVCLPAAERVRDN